VAEERRELDGWVALVTGGSRGIGRAISVDLAKRGADVAFTYRTDHDGAKITAKQIEATGRCALALKADGRDPVAPGKAVMDVVGRFGRIDILVNNAGLNKDGVVWKLSDDAWNEVVDADLGAAFRYTRAVIPIFREAGVGRIVNISSINGLRGKFGQSNYAAAKAGLIGFTKSIARELGGFNVTANVVAPGLIETDMVRAMPEEARQKSLSEIVLGKLGTPEDVAAAVSFLAGPGAGHITGVVLQVDGGQYL
jgi:3-oxoacyl-[acyl-carrier protein] reductase